MSDEQQGADWYQQQNLEEQEMMEEEESLTPYDHFFDELSALISEEITKVAPGDKKRMEIIEGFIALVEKAHERCKAKGK